MGVIIYYWLTFFTIFTLVGGGGGQLCPPPLGFFCLNFCWLTFPVHNKTWQLLFWWNTNYGKIWKKWFLNMLWKKVNCRADLPPSPFRVLYNSGSPGQLLLVKKFTPDGEKKSENYLVQKKGKTHSALLHWSVGWKDDFWTSWGRNHHALSLSS